MTKPATIQYVKRGADMSYSMTPSGSTGSAVPTGERAQSAVVCWSHILLVITGLICYIIWKERNIDAARHHLVHSIWLGFVVWGLLVVFGLLIPG